MHILNGARVAINPGGPLDDSEGPVAHQSTARSMPHCIAQYGQCVATRVTVAVFPAQAAASSSAAAAPSSIAPATTSYADDHARSYSGRHAAPATCAIDAISTPPTTG